jgi:hypothetical protein
MRLAYLLPVLIVGCAHVDYGALDAAHSARSSAASRESDLAVAHAIQVRERLRQEILRRWEQQRVAFNGDEVANPLVTPAIVTGVSLCLDPVSCEAVVTQGLDQRYSKAPSNFRVRAQEALQQLPPWERLTSYERILARGENFAAKAWADRAWARVKTRYALDVQRAQDQYRAEVDSSLRQRERDLEAEQQRVDRANSEAATAIAVGLVAAAAIGAAAASSESASSSSGSGSGYAPSYSACPRVEYHDSQGCCSYHGGIDRLASLALGQVMCLDRQRSPTCLCW